MALLITLFLIQLCLPLFNNITEKNFVLPLTSFSMWQVLLYTLLSAILLNGIYPAVLLSSFKPLNVLRGRSVLKFHDGAIRKGLVVFQFTLSIILIIGTIIIFRQVNYIQSTKPGYNVSQIMSLQIPYKVTGTLMGNGRNTFIKSMKQELESNSAIESVSTGGSEIINIYSACSGNADWDGRDSRYNPTIASLSADADFAKMFELKLTEGRWFSSGTGDGSNYILNETAAANFNMHKPLIGQRFTWSGHNGQVIGVIKDFPFKSMHEKIGPMVLSYNGGADNLFFIRTSPGNIPKALSAAATVWNKFIPDEPFSYTFLDDSFNTLYKADIKTSQLILIFAVLGIIISALGLFGLAAFTTEQRTKEMGIRKILGASVQQITTLVSREFVKLVAVAIVIASPLAWWVMNKWLQDFAYRINIGPGIFITAASLGLLVAICSVSIQAIKAAIANPVKSLRTE